MTNCVNTKKVGIEIKADREWNGGKGHKFKVEGQEKHDQDHHHIRRSTSDHKIINAEHSEAINNRIRDGQHSDYCLRYAFC